MDAAAREAYRRNKTHGGTPHGRGAATTAQGRVRHAGEAAEVSATRMAGAERNRTVSHGGARRPRAALSRGPRRAGVVQLVPALLLPGVRLDECGALARALTYGAHLPRWG